MRTTSKYEMLFMVNTMYVKESLEYTPQTGCTGNTCLSMLPIFDAAAQRAAALSARRT